jgi:hypothetical protein
LEFVRLTGHGKALAAGIKTLNSMKRFRMPRGAQTWELPLHTPDLLAVHHLVYAYVRGYGSQEWSRGRGSAATRPLAHRIGVPDERDDHSLGMGLRSESRSLPMRTWV